MLLGLFTYDFPETVETAGVNLFINAIEEAGITNANINLIFDAVEDIDMEDLFIECDCCQWLYFDFEAFSELMPSLIDTYLEFGLTGTQVGIIIFELANSALGVYQQHLPAIAEYAGISLASLQDYIKEAVEIVAAVVALGRTAIVNAINALFSLQAQFDISDTLIDIIMGVILADDGDNPILSLTREEFITVVTGLAGDLSSAIGLLTDDVLNTLSTVMKLFTRFYFPDPNASWVQYDIEWLEREISELTGIITDIEEGNYIAWWLSEWLADINIGLEYFSEQLAEAIQNNEYGLVDWLEGEIDRMKYELEEAENQIANWREDELDRLREDLAIFERQLSVYSDLETNIPIRIGMFNTALDNAVKNFGAVRATVNAATSTINRDWAGRLYDAVNATPQNEDEAVRLVGRVLGAAATASGGVTPQLIAETAADFIVALDYWSTMDMDDYRKEVIEDIQAEVQEFFDAGIAFNAINPGGALPTDCYITDLIRYALFGEEACDFSFGSSGIFGNSEPITEPGNLSWLEHSRLAANSDGTGDVSVWFDWGRGMIGRTNEIWLAISISIFDVAQGHIWIEIWLDGTYVIDGNSITITIEALSFSDALGNEGQIQIDYLTGTITSGQLIIPVAWDDDYNTLAYGVFHRHMW